MQTDKSAPLSNSARAAQFILDTRNVALSAETLDAAKMCLADWVAVCIGARITPEADILRKFLLNTGQVGDAPLLSGGKADVATAALINGTLSHCLDYDDTHIPTALHGSGPVWASTLALGTHLQSTEEDILKAFVCGFEIGASIGNKGLGVRLNENGWHSTAVLGRLASAAAASYLLNLDASAIENALGLAATQAGGLTASFGTMAKPFHAGKAAADGILAARLAQSGIDASRDLLDSPKGLFGTIFQDRKTIPYLGDLGQVQEILRNSLKPYAACQLTHAPIDAAILLGDLVGKSSVKSICVHVHPLAIEIASVRNALTPTEGRFSTAYCIALALKGYPISPEDFVPERLSDPELVDLASRVTMEAYPNIERTACSLVAVLSDGRTVKTEVEHAFGSIGNPMGWPQLEVKFKSLVEPDFGNETAEFMTLLANFERPGSFARCLAYFGNLSTEK